MSDEQPTTAYEARSPAQLAEEIARADTVKLRFDEEIYQLTKGEVDWIALSLRGIALNGRPPQETTAQEADHG